MNIFHVHGFQLIWEGKNNYGFTKYCNVDKEPIKVEGQKVRIELNMGQEEGCSFLKLRDFFFQESNFGLKILDPSRWIVGWKNFGYLWIQTSCLTSCFENHVSPYEAWLTMVEDAVGIYCIQQNELVFHGSSVRWKEKGILFLGHSCAGKSSIAAWLTARGAEFFNDDIVRVDVDNRIYRGSGILRLWDEGNLEWWKTKGFSPFTQSSEGKSFFFIPTQEYCTPLDIILILVPVKDLTLRPYFELCTGANALLSLLEHTLFTLLSSHFSAPVFPFVQEQLLFNRLSEIANRIPIYRFIFPSLWLGSLEQNGKQFIQDLENLL